MSEHNEIHQSYTTGDIHNQTVDEHYDPTSRKAIWKTFWILLIATIVEVAIAFAGMNKDLLQWIYVALTIFKAAYIVGVFMHLFHEAKSLMYTILLPFLLIVYLIAMAIAEGSYLHILKNVQ